MSLSRRSRYSSASSGGGGGGGANAQAMNNASDYMFRDGGGLANDTYNRFYYSYWGRHAAPVTSIGLAFVGISGNAIHQSRIQLNVFNRYEFSVGIEIYNGGSPFGATYNFNLSPAPTAAQWYHLLMEYDSTEAVSTNRLKFYLNDVLVPNSGPSQDDLNGKIWFQGSELAVYGVGSLNSPDTYSNNQKGCWMKFATTNLFDFSSSTDRRNFIGSSGEYVTHQSVMGGQTADFWAEGSKDSVLAQGWTDLNSTINATVGSIVAGSP